MHSFLLPPVASPGRDGSGRRLAVIVCAVWDQHIVSEFIFLIHGYMFIFSISWKALLDGPYTGHNRSSKSVINFHIWVMRVGIELVAVNCVLMDFCYFAFF